MIAKEGYTTILVVVIFSVAVAYVGSWLILPFNYLIYAIVGALSFLVIYFFRDPDRNIPIDKNLILSPADGKVVLIKQVDNAKYVNQKVTQVSIFLSPLNVHVNRNPLSGDVEYARYFPGKYLMAWEDHASEENEQAHFGVKHDSGTKVLFKQITGFLARRIVYHIKEGDKIKAGERFGIMKFGSRMDILVPDNVELKIKKGDRTVAGESIIGIIK